MRRYQIFANDSIPLPQICAIGFASNPNVTFFGPSVRNQYIIHYVISGEGIFNGNRVKKGEGFLITPGLHEEYAADEGNPWAFVWIISTDPAMKYFFERHNASAETGIFEFFNLYEVEAVAKWIKSSERSSFSSAQLSETFLHIFHSCIETESNSQIPAPKLYFDFSVNYIKTNLHLPISVDELCCATGITQPYLYRIFKQYANCSPKQFILNGKLNKAKKLLLQTDLLISQIADSVGFESVLDFSKFFSKKCGVSPTEFRNKRV